MDAPTTGQLRLKPGNTPCWLETEPGVGHQRITV